MILRLIAMALAAAVGVALVVAFAPGPVGFGPSRIGVALTVAWIVGLALWSWRESRR